MPLGVAWYPSAAWQPGRILQTRPRFTLPGQLTAGTYQASLSVTDPGTSVTSRPVALGQLIVADRPRRFDLPPGGDDISVACGEVSIWRAVELPSRVVSGAAAPITLTWQAGGLTTHNWKVFIHIFDSAGSSARRATVIPWTVRPCRRPGKSTRSSLICTLSRCPPICRQVTTLCDWDSTTSKPARVLLCGDGDTVTLPRPLRVHGQ